ncbi:Cytoplasmic tRNA 2-thiolation protein 2 [Venustampulla echinocandica]|uniref:Cytoplasmic tRNA 2-thiolation protein 2 n=1 Tax=Venustampulla echinocandica TaxID=2656787 RepID=A0A370TW06_9HELO|nr:Cytoplasmic tRNA 2-thiolation protein 2 [Venustampulla echinocandica]RDL39711.1 Cytoplasmic tRNA 2-thiolation protein 2 [Venustampulla echinocandica]
MSGAEITEAGAENALCKRCHQYPITHQIRSEHVCKNCFIQYVMTKAVKRMETYRVRGPSTQVRKLLLPFSFGPSSASLLYMLDQHIQGQFDRRRRAAYELYVVHIDLYLDPADRKDASELLEKYEARFPRHTYLSIGLEEALLLDDIDWKALNIERPPETDVQRPAAERLQHLLGSMSSATSRADIASTLLTRLLVDTAKRNNCDSVLFGDSTTRLAEKTLTETAKGRGFALPWQVSDKASPYGIAFNYPLRDLLKKEIVAYTTLTTPPLSDLVIYQEPLSHISASSKSTTIDDLMAQYFQSVEENYPSIVANVVRTSSKLQSPTTDDTTECGLCGLPVARGTDGIHGWGGDQNPGSQPTNENRSGILCYGCSRSMNS